MTTKTRTITTHALSRSPGAAKQATKSGPLIITTRGEPTHVLMSFDHYLQLKSAHTGITALLAMPGAPDFEPVRLEPGRLLDPDFE